MMSFVWQRLELTLCCIFKWMELSSNEREFAGCDCWSRMLSIVSSVVMNDLFGVIPLSYSNVCLLAIHDNNTTVQSVHTVISGDMFDFNCKCWSGCVADRLRCSTDGGALHSASEYVHCAPAASTIANVMRSHMFIACHCYCTCKICHRSDRSWWCASHCFQLSLSLSTTIYESYLICAFGYEIVGQAHPLSESRSNISTMAFCPQRAVHSCIDFCFLCVLLLLVGSNREPILRRSICE